MIEPFFVFAAICAIAVAVLGEVWRGRAVAERHLRMDAERRTERAERRLEHLDRLFSVLSTSQRERLEFFQAVVEERNRQDAKWGTADRWTPDQFARILGEEFGEVCEAINDRDWKNLEVEAVQVAACCLKWREVGKREGEP